MPNLSSSNHDRLEEEHGQNHSNTPAFISPSDRRTFLQGAAATAAAGAATFAWPAWARRATAAGDLDAIRTEIEKRHDDPSNACRIGFANPPSPPKTAV